MENLSTRQIILKTLDHFPSDCFGNVQNHTPCITNETKKFLNLLYKSLLESQKGPYVNGADLSFLAEKLMERKENKRLSGSSERSGTPESPSDVVYVSENQNMESIVDSIVASSAPEMDTFQIINKTLEYFGPDFFGNEPNISKFTTRTPGSGTPESSIHVTELSRRTSFSGEKFSDELEGSRCQKTGEILEDSGTSPPCYIDGNVKTSCDECFKKTNCLNF
ncbi:hypothetical protein B9Z55_015451 [Caenorhabditis nigoni]|uniref:Uncharacterized protein n=1 Tax=Caenorhabditis nigoni TaxID=1611254 RepID=A0A2G5UA89_9PELO|nr:hypothetical protein B9Z55_015451 [Caenorhabditis nigoni]